MVDSVLLLQHIDSWAYMLMASRHKQMEWSTQPDRRWTIMTLHFINVIAEFRIYKKEKGPMSKLIT